MNNNYFVFFENSNKNFRVLYNDDTFDTLIDKPKESEYHRYELMKGFKGNDAGLVEFKAAMIKWNEELKNNGILSIDWFKYYSHFHAVELTFKRLCKGKYEHFDPIDATESEWIESTHNGGLNYCEPGEHQSFGYDFSSFYPICMVEYHFEMPFKKGKEVKLTKLPKKLDLGFYRVKITSDHKHATKLFAFCKTHTYTNISLNHALDLEEDYDFKFELIIDDKPNAYIYPKGVKSKEVFGNWCEKLFKIKQKYPKNKLIKHLLSSLHGSLSRSNNVFKTFDQIEEEELKVSMNNDADYKIIDYIVNEDKEIYKLQSMIQPYRYNFRLKSFLTSFGRVKIANVATYNLNDVIRVQTDGIVFTSQLKVNFPLLIKEDKTTGLIKWENVNKYSDLL